MATPARHTSRTKGHRAGHAGRVRRSSAGRDCGIERQPRTRPVGGAGSPSRDTLANPKDKSLFARVIRFEFVVPGG